MAEMDARDKTHDLPRCKYNFGFKRVYRPNRAGGDVNCVQLFFS